MTVIVGGLRARLIRESLYQMLREALDDLDWFDVSVNRSTVTFPAKSVDPQDDVPVNTLGLADEDSSSKDWELGSLFGEHRSIFDVDFFAENEAIGMHLIRDVKDILGGRFPSIGRDDPSFSVFDYRQATPPVVTVCQIENVFIEKSATYEREYRKHWYSCRFDVIDYYGTEDDV